MPWRPTRPWEAAIPLCTSGEPLDFSSRCLQCYFRLKDDTVEKIAKKHNVESGNVLISFQGEQSNFLVLVARIRLIMCLVERGIIVLPKSVTPARIEKNIKLVKLDEEDMKSLNGLNKGHRFVKPDWGKDVHLEFPDWD